MSSTMARQEGHILLEQSDMCPALNMAKMAKGRYSRTAIQETSYTIKIPRINVWEWKTGGVESSRPGRVNSLIAWHLAIVRENQMDSCLICQNGPVKYLWTCWRCKEPGVPRPQPMPPLHCMSPALPDDNETSQGSQIEGVPPGYVYIHTPHPKAHCVNLDASARDLKRTQDLIPDCLTHEGTFTGLYTICCIILGLTFTLRTIAASWANLKVKTSIDQRKLDFWVYYYQQLADTL